MGTTIGPFTVPAADSGAGSISKPERASQIDKLFGRDIWFDVTESIGANYIVTPSGDWQTCEGRECLRQSIIRRIITDPGEWQAIPEYGIGARRFVKARNTQAVRDELKERIRSQIEEEPGVETLDQVFVDVSEGVLKIGVVITPKGRALQNEPLRVSVEVS